MKTLKTIILGFTILSFAFSCKNKEAAKSNDVNNIKNTVEIAGNYVSSEYEKRNEGADWVGVTVVKYTDSTLHITARSRADKKKPTCTFDADAIKLNDSVFQSSFEGKKILFVFTENNLTIKTQNEAESDALYYFCSGGATLANNYSKINEDLDQSQIDQRVFQKMLNFQNIGFDISTTGKGSIQQLTISPYGLEIDNSAIKLEIEGAVVNAEIEDLNADGYPEILIYTVSAGSGSYGNVIGYSVNNGKSISQIYFPPISENAEVSKGYMGHDEFAIVETTLVQRFKIYNEGDNNANPTGKTRQIQYKLKDGEASRLFVIEKVETY
ncbi:hypothetical protein EC396_10165 [Lutibacter sp. HS1-25]|uniref:PliI family lysozyme inhibitor of I-type lysozyme n=1 Tax=Lutibacter sp. HS1-25 TaxID=2485000 RepID=UPI0010130728|nr:PliI family lysozyme inhibitor of I-type lysozyme [Lutibacter sp. HS1-25]RXP53454.1 hypothetical protein EC396_10165 [Lutibacter sp. HS1-25]